MRVIVLLGGPGAGKGTQAPVLAGQLELVHVSTGDLFRAAVRDGSAIGLEARRFMERGQLVPDDITIRMLLGRFDQPDAKAGAILDGFPRNGAQAKALDDALAERGEAVDLAPLIEVDSEEIYRRMSGRWLCRDAGHVYNETSNPPAVEGVCDIDGSPLYQREDDKPETVRARLHLQLASLQEVIDHYASTGILRRVKGQQPIDDVFRDLLVVVQDGAASSDA